jgi:hypothetical protein
MNARSAQVRCLIVTAGLLMAAAGRAEPGPGELAIPGTDSTLKLYGFVRLDTTVDFAGRPVGYENTDWATFLGAVPEDDSAAAKRARPQTYFTARTSRLGVQTRTPTRFGDLTVRLEGDFNAPNDFQTETYTNSVLFRLRHAYASVGGLLVGQTWSTFFDGNAAPDTVDFNGPGTQTFVRNPMIRYTLEAGDQARVALAVENTRGPMWGAESRYQVIPDLHAAFEWTPRWGTVNARGVVQFYNRARLAGGDYADSPGKSKAGLGVALSGSVKVGGDTLVWLFAGGPGIGRYLFNSATIGDTPGVSFDDASGKITLWSVWGGHAGYTHVWNPTVRSNLVLAYTRVVDAKIGGAESTNAVQKDFRQAFVNGIFSVTRTSSVGVEYAWGQWTSFTNGTSELRGTQHRVNAAFTWGFY